MGSYKFSLRSSYGLSAWCSHNGSFYSNIYNGTNTDPALVTPSGQTGVFGGGQLIDLSATSGLRGLWYVGLNNIGPLNPGVSVRMRIVPRWSGAPANTQALFFLGVFAANQLSSIELSILNNGTLQLVYHDSGGGEDVGSAITTPCSFTAGTATDIQLSWDGSEGTGVFVASQDGAVLGSWTLPTGFGPPSGKFDYTQMANIQVGSTVNTPDCDYYLNEFNVADYALPTTYTPRTTYDPIAQFDAFASTDPGIANVKTGTSYEIDGVALTGTLGPYGSMDPGIANVLFGVNYAINGTPLTGTLQQVINQYTSPNLVVSPEPTGMQGQIGVTQGDTATINLQAVDVNGNPVNLTGATFSTQIDGPNAAGPVVFSNAKHTITDAVLGQFQLTLQSTDTALLGEGAFKTVLTQVTQGLSLTTFRGIGLLTVYSGVPSQ